MAEGNTTGLAMINRTPAQWTVFKGQSAMRLQLQKNETLDDKYKTGCVSLQIAPFKEKRGETRIYNWEEKKISCKLGVNDITTIIYALRFGQEVKLYHEFNGVSKSINMNLNTEKGGYFLSVQQNGENAQKLNVPLSSQETYGMLVMLEAALPLIHNWF